MLCVWATQHTSSSIIHLLSAYQVARSQFYSCKRPVASHRFTMMRSSIIPFIVHHFDRHTVDIQSFTGPQSPAWPVRPRYLLMGWRHSSPSSLPHLMLLALVLTAARMEAARALRPTAPSAP